MATLAQSLPESLDILRCGRWSARKKVSDLSDFLRLLRGGQRAKRKEHSAQRDTKNPYTHVVCPHPNPLLKGEGIGVVNPKFLAIAYCLLPNAFGYFRSTMCLTISF